MKPRHMLCVVLAVVLSLVAGVLCCYGEGNADEATFTRIVIDGQPDDWVGRPVLLSDPAGNAQTGFVDMTTGYGFVNQHAVYLLVEVVDANAQVTQFMIWFKADSRALVLEWSVHDAFGVVSEEMPNGDLILIGRAIHSAIAFGPALEMRIDLRDLELPEDLFLESINAHAGRGRPVDVWGPMVAPPRVNEADPENLLAEELVRNSERPCHFSVVGADAEGGYLYRGFIQIPLDLTASSDGSIYVVDQNGQHVVRFALDGTTHDLPLWTYPYVTIGWNTRIACDSTGVPHLSSFNGGIYSVDSKGDVSAVPNILKYRFTALAFSPTDELYLADDGQILEAVGNVNLRVVTSEVDPVRDLIFGHDGLLYATQRGPNVRRVLAVNVEVGMVSRVLYDELPRDASYITVDSEGDVWVHAANTLYQFSPEGTPKPFLVDGRSYWGEAFELDLGTGGGIAFDNAGRLWIAGYTSQIWRLDPVQGDPDRMTLVLAVPGFCASDLALAPDGSVYACNVNPHPGELWRVSPNGDVETLLHFDHAGRAADEKFIALASDDEGNLYIGYPTGEIKRRDASGALMPYAWMPKRVEHLAVGTDGYLYAVVGKLGGAKSIVRITGVNNYEPFLNQLGGQPLSGWDILIETSPSGGFYVYNSSQEKVYDVGLDGRSRVVAEVAGATAMAVSPDEEIFLVLHGVLPESYPDEYRYSVLRVDTEGGIHLLARGIWGDPQAVEVSSDGHWLYVAENGSIDKIPIAAND